MHLNKSSAVAELTAQCFTSRFFCCQLGVPLFNALFLSNLWEYHHCGNLECLGSETTDIGEITQNNCCYAVQCHSSHRYQSRAYMPLPMCQMWTYILGLSRTVFQDTVDYWSNFRCRIITYLGLVVFIFRITISAIYLWLLFTLCMSELMYCSVDFNKLNDDNDDDRGLERRARGLE